MDEKTEELRDIFMEVADEETVTESQTEQRGSLLRESSVDDRLAELVGRMRDRFGFDTSLSDRDLCTVIRGFYDGQNDGDIADELDISRGEIVTARLDLHLVRDGDTSGLDVPTLRERLDADESVSEIAADLDAKPADIERGARALETDERSRRVSQRFRTEFEEILTDADIAVRLTAATQRDGLDEATEGMEVDVEF